MLRSILLPAALVGAVTALAGPTFAQGTTPQVCVATSGGGGACLTTQGWTAHGKVSKAPLNDEVGGAAPCGEALLFADYSGVKRLMAQGWSDLQKPAPTVSSPTGLACDVAGRQVWITHFKGVSHHQDGRWSTVEASALANGAAANDLVKGVTVAPDGKIWVATARSVARRDEAGWTVFQQGQGFDKPVFLDQIVADAKGRVWVAGLAGLAVFENGAWRMIDRALQGVRALDVDPKGQVWVGTQTGLHVYDGTGWRSIAASPEGLASNTVRAVKADAAGRIWVGTSYGLSVLDGDRWSTYRMDNSDLPANQVNAVAVSSPALKTLPPTAAKPPGRLIARVVGAESKPLSGLRTELCIERLVAGLSRVQDTPCTGQAFTRSARTDTDGRIEFASLPAGQYVLTLETAPNRWALLSGLIGAAATVTVRPGATTDLQTLNVKPGS